MKKEILMKEAMVKLSWLPLTAPPDVTSPLTWQAPLRDKPPHKGVQPAGHAEENGQLQYEVAAEAPEPQDGCLLKTKISLTDCRTVLLWDCQNLWLFLCQAVKLPENWT